ncbi:MAG: hypothetical protein HQL37_16680 [Alphaproteobacteria bacterium]|nr:hypothetical protein [Alphaproteobacteria bacterium]
MTTFPGTWAVVAVLMGLAVSPPVLAQGVPSRPHRAAAPVLTDEIPISEIPNYRDFMREIVIALSAYAKGRDPAFAVLVHGSSELFAKSQREAQLEDLKDPEGLDKIHRTPQGTLMSRFAHAVDGLVLDGHTCGAEAEAEATAQQAEHAAASKAEAEAAKADEADEAAKKPVPVKKPIHLPKPTAANRISRLEPLPPSIEADDAPPPPPLPPPSAAEPPAAEKLPDIAMLHAAMGAVAQAARDRTAALRKSKHDQLATVKNEGIRLMAIEHCHSDAQAAHAVARNEAEHIMTFADADPTGALDRIPKARPWGENSLTIHALRESRNMLVLLDAHNYPPRLEYVTKVGSNNYDLLIIDGLNPGQPPLSKGEIYDLHFKRLGAKRLVMARLDLGQARDYLYYWKNEWRPGAPKWLDSPIPNTPGAVAVRYWDEEWKKIIGDSFKGLMDLGVDGIMLDGIDAYRLFESRTPLE